MVRDKGHVRESLPNLKVEAEELGPKGAQYEETLLPIKTLKKYDWGNFWQTLLPLSGRVSECAPVGTHDESSSLHEWVLFLCWHATRKIRKRTHLWMVRGRTVNSGSDWMNVISWEVRSESWCWTKDNSTSVDLARSHPWASDQAKYEWAKTSITCILVI